MINHPINGLSTHKRRDVCSNLTQECFRDANIVFGLGAHEPAEGNGARQRGKIDEDGSGEALRVQSVLAKV